MSLPGFTVNQLRFVTEVAAPLRLPPHKGSSLRGGLFEALRSQFCFSPAACGGLHTSACPVCFLLAPVDLAASRGRDIPRPYVLRPPTDERSEYAPGERFEFHLLTFGRALGHFPYALLGVQEMGRHGLGAGRAELRLQEVWAEHPLLGSQQRVYRAPDPTVHGLTLSITDDQVCEEAARWAAPGCLTLRFRLPMRLTDGGRLVGDSTWTFRPFFQRLLERLASLSSAYGPAVEVPFAPLLAAADAIRTDERRLRWWDLFRYSGRQGRRLPMGGLVGEVSIAGDLEPLLPWLVWGQFTHVGKYADHGNGWYELVPPG